MVKLSVTKLRVYAKGYVSSIPKISFILFLIAPLFFSFKDFMLCLRQHFSDMLFTLSQILHSYPFSMLEVSLQNQYSGCHKNQLRHQIGLFMVADFKTGLGYKIKSQNCNSLKFCKVF